MSWDDIKLKQIRVATDARKVIIMMKLTKENEKLEKEVKSMKERIASDEMWSLEDFEVLEDKKGGVADFYISIGDSSLISKFHLRKTKEGVYYVMHPYKSKGSNGKYYYNLRFDGVRKLDSEKIVGDIEFCIVDAWKKYKGIYQEKELQLKKGHSPDCSSCYYCTKEVIGHESDSGKYESKAHYCFLKDVSLDEEVIDTMNEMLKRGEVKTLSKQNKSMLIRETLEGRLVFRPKGFFEEGSLGLCRHYCGSYDNDRYSLRSGYTYWESEMVAKVAISKNNAIRLDFDGMEVMAEDKYEDLSPAKDKREWFKATPHGRKSQVKIRRREFYVEFYAEKEGDDSIEEVFEADKHKASDMSDGLDNDHLAMTDARRIKVVLEKEYEDDDKEVEAEKKRGYKMVLELMKAFESKEARMYGYPSGYDMIDDNKVLLAVVENDDYSPEGPDGGGEDTPNKDIDDLYIYRSSGAACTMSRKTFGKIIISQQKGVENNEVSPDSGADLFIYRSPGAACIRTKNNKEEIRMKRGFGYQPLIEAEYINEEVAGQARKIKQKLKKGDDNMRINVEDLTRIDGIGEATVKKIQKEGLNIINLSMDSEVRLLKAVDGIGQATVDKIIEGVKELTYEKEVDKLDKEEVDEIEENETNNKEEEIKMDKNNNLLVEEKGFSYKIGSYIYTRLSVKISKKKGVKFEGLIQSTNGKWITFKKLDNEKVRYGFSFYKASFQKKLRNIVNRGFELAEEVCDGSNVQGPIEATQENTQEEVPAPVNNAAKIILQEKKMTLSEGYFRNIAVKIRQDNKVIIDILRGNSDNAIASFIFGKEGLVEKEFAHKNVSKQMQQRLEDAADNAMAAIS